MHKVAYCPYVKPLEYYTMILENEGGKGLIKTLR